MQGIGWASKKYGILYLFKLIIEPENCRPPDNFARDYLINYRNLADIMSNLKQSKEHLI